MTIFTPGHYAMAGYRRGLMTVLREQFWGMTQHFWYLKRPYIPKIKGCDPKEYDEFERWFETYKGEPSGEIR